jgi:hypothetical protein
LLALNHVARPKNYEEPDALIAHVRICGGRGKETSLFYPTNCPNFGTMELLNYLNYLKGGMLGLGHIMKGTSEMGNPVYEYEYIDKYINSSPVELLLFDLKIISKGIKVIFEGKGL